MDAAKLNGVRDMGWVEEVSDRLNKGATLVCKGEGRWPTKGPNNKSAYEEGARMADSLQNWTNEGFMYGPFKEEEMPWPSWKTSPLTMRPKPDGSVDLIVD